MDPVVEMYVAQGLHGLAYGMILFLIASGLTIIFGMMGILNLAHAYIFMLSSYVCYQIVTMTDNFWVALLVAPLLMAILGLVIERFMLRRIYNYGHLEQLILTVGVGFLIVGSVIQIWGTENLPVAVPPSLQGMVSIAGMYYPIYRLFIIGAALLVTISMILVLYATLIGKIVRAAVSDRDMVSALGINVPLVFSLVFSFGMWLAGVAGVVIAPLLTVFPGLADQVGMDAFKVVVTGGFGSLSGAFIVSMIFGFLSSYGIQFFSQLAPILAVGFMAIVLAIRPQGLFGEKEDD
ncbi:MAG: branched-chain amino acid ABC transporter permease [Desulfobacteraceae bacterium]|nr:MAG: branched-chain amino acid ABC transporter permease [Desulfobacteraceae bacterium]